MKHFKPIDAIHITTIILFRKWFFIFLYYDSLQKGPWFNVGSSYKYVGQNLCGSVILYQTVVTLVKRAFSCFGTIFFSI